MSDSPQYQAFREFARATIALEVMKATQPLQEEVRSLRTQLETRSAQAGPAGKDGAPGADGKDGAPGAKGDSGVAGERGQAGERGADGLHGRDGAPGANGRDGSAGDRGERGADGIATREELTALVEESHRDIVVRSFADTYRDIYRDGEAYGRGDVVTYGGCLWLAKVETRAKPGTDEGWRMIVKAGRDGRK